MDTHHDLTKKTTILFPPDLYTHLVQVARSREVSVGHLVRAACEQQYGAVNAASRTRAVRQLAHLALPVDDIETMLQESVPAPAALLP